MKSLSPYNKIATEVIRALRGTYTQMHLSQRLGYTTNQVYRWESGSRSISWNDFVRLCEATQAPLSRAIKITGYTKKPSDTLSLLKHLRAQKSISELSHSTKLSQHTLANWYGSKSTPHLSHFLLFFDKHLNMLTDILEFLVNLDELKTLHQIHKDTLKKKNSLHRHPELMSIYAALDLEEYKNMPCHQSGWISRITSIPQKKEKTFLKLMEKNNLIKLENGKYTLLKKSMSFNGSHQEIKKLKKYYSCVVDDDSSCWEREDTLRNFSIYVSSVSKTAHEEIFKKLHEFIAAYKSIQENDPHPKTEIVVLDLNYNQIKS